MRAVRVAHCRSSSSSSSATSSSSGRLLLKPRHQQPVCSYRWLSSSHLGASQTQLVDNNNNTNNNNSRHHHHPPQLGGSVGSVFHHDVAGNVDRSHGGGNVVVVDKSGDISPSLSTNNNNTTTTEDVRYGQTPRTSVLMELTDRVGVLHDVLKYFWKYDINICRIESRPVVPASSSSSSSSLQRHFDFLVDFETPTNLDGTVDDRVVHRLLQDLSGLTAKLLILDEKQVQWFPRHISELDDICHRVLDAGLDLQADHPGFADPEYRRRRGQLACYAQQHRWDQPIPHIHYTPAEISVWSTVWDRMQALWPAYACQEYQAALQLMSQHCGYARDQIPQQQQVHDFLQTQTQFRLRPVAGLLSSRDFLNGLAFRTFFCTQYIRHASRPLYTPEPDICHELLGHAPMLADRDFADFSQEIGLASLGASDEDITKLARCYWHSVEFGLCREQQGQPKAYGAGLLSSFGELEYACHPDHPGASEPPTLLPWDPAVAARQEFPITTYQPVYFCADSLREAKIRMRRYCEDLARPFFASYNAQTQTVHIDRPVRRTHGVP